MAKDVVRIGGASGFWGDASMSTPQLLAAGNVDYIVYDYLAEITMSIMGRARAQDPTKGYAGDFISAVLAPSLREIARQKVKIISNAGGVNVVAAGEAVKKAVAALDLPLKVAVIEGDDLYDKREAISRSGYAEMFSNAAFPALDQLVSVNAYLGAFPIAQALADGADIVITGRCVDSAVTLGACIYEFGWTPEDHDKLAGGSLAGHIIECGPQATGGNFTDWRLVAETIHEVGYPIAEMKADGSFVCTKPEGTGGLVNIGTVGEQLVYEIGDPQAYMLPDVVCDFSGVKLEQLGPNRVQVSGARGRAAPDTYKVSGTYSDGFRTGTLSTFYGLDAGEKAAAYSEAVLKRARAALRGRNLPDFTETSVELLGAGSHYGAGQDLKAAREVVAKIAVRHPDQSAANLFLKEATGLGLAAPPSLSGFTGGGRTSVQPVVRLFSFLIPRAELEIKVTTDGRTAPFKDVAGRRVDPNDLAKPQTPPVPATVDSPVRVPLVSIAWGRSGDKGDKANVGLIARSPDFYPYILRAVTPQSVAERFAHFVEGKVDRYDLPGFCAVNFLMHEALGGGGIASLRNDPQAKGFAALLLDQDVEVPASLAEKHKLPVVQAA